MRHRTGGGLKSGSYVWVGMVVKKSEKLSTGFSDHERPRMTTLDQVRPHQKQWRKKGSTPTRGASLPSFVICFTVLTRIYAQGGGHEGGQKRIESSQSDTLQDTILLHHPTQFETVRYVFL